MPRFNPYRQFIAVVVIPNCILKVAEISQGAKLAWARLAQYAGESGDAYPSLKTLGQELGVKEDQARRYVEELVKAGFLEREDRPGYTPKYWHLDDHPCFHPTTEGSHISQGGGGIYARGGVAYMPPEENQIRESNKGQEERVPEKEASIPLCDQGDLEHFLDKQLRAFRHKPVLISTGLRKHLQRLDRQVVDREAFRKALIYAIYTYDPDGRGRQTLGEAMFAFREEAEAFPKVPQPERRKSAKSTHQPVAEATRETRLGWIREFEEKEAAKAKGKGLRPV